MHVSVCLGLCHGVGAVLGCLPWSLGVLVGPCVTGIVCGCPGIELETALFPRKEQSQQVNHLPLLFSQLQKASQKYVFPQIWTLKKKLGATLGRWEKENQASSQTSRLDAAPRNSQGGFCDLSPGLHFRGDLKLQFGARWPDT